VERECTGELSFYNIHTREALATRYLDHKGRFDENALNRINHLFRCHHTGEVHPIDPKLFLFMDAARSRLGAESRTIRLISGYRSQEYNRLLRSKSRNVAKKSYHLKGMAADVRIEGVPLASLREVAQQLGVGGVGSYRDFIHFDVGPVRSW
jgi:uncharacterized protein YcbK (DUF882 family)